jgi:hypothetical protein
MKGRWTVTVDPFRRTEVPVVPCDDAAIERVAKALTDIAEDYWDEMDDYEREPYRARARKVLRAAGETP